MPMLRSENFIAALVQDAHHDAFAVQHRDDRDADVDLAAAHLELDAAVLRQALLGDVQPGHDLQAADDRGLKAIDLRRHRLRLQHAVDAVANLNAGRLRLDVHVAGPRFDRLDQNFVHQPNDRGLLRHLRSSEPSVSISPSSSTSSSGCSQALDRFAADAEVRLDELGDLGPAGENRDRR